MKEIEMKIININREKTERLIRSLGAKKTFDDIIITVFFDYPDASIKQAKNLIRLRKTGKKSFVTFKKYVKNPKAKVRQEFEVEVSDYSTMYTIMNCLGLQAEVEVKKHRVSYVLDAVHFEFDKHLDDYEFIPDFLEIEARDEAALDVFIKRLGFTEDQCKSWSFFEVADYYKAKKSS